MVAKIVVEEGDFKGLSLSLEEGDAWTVGRDIDECQLVIEDPLVSRRHLIVRRTSEGIAVENLSTTNPALLNDEEINNQTRILQNGDTIKLGNEILRFYEDASAHVLDENMPDFNLAPEEEFDEMEFDEMESPTPEETMTPPSTTPPPPPSTPPPSIPDTVLEEEEEIDVGSLLAEIDFGVIETGRWLLKVIGGPNNGAEFYMQANNSYVLGTDPHSCDIVFHDTSVSRQHARITVTPEDTLSIEDLKSRNGILISGKSVEGRQELPLNIIVTLGTTSFIVYDREGEMQTIISPLLPSIVKVLQQEPAKTEEALASQPVQAAEPETTPLKTVEEPKPPTKPPRQAGPYIVLSTIIALFALAGIGTSLLFKEEPAVTMQTQENAEELIQQVLQPFPSVRWTFNKSTGGLLLLGHVATQAEKSQLLYNLGTLRFIKNMDADDIVIDEGVWNEINSLLSSKPEWRGISVHSPAAGQFILSGQLQTRKQAEELSGYLHLNFPYLDLLKKQIVVEEDVVNEIHVWLQNAQLFDVIPKMNNGEVNLNGLIPPEKSNEFNEIIGKIKQIPGVRIVNNLVRSQTVETGILDISDHYEVTGKSRIGNKFTVVINGHILSEGDDLEDMTITQITADRISLEKNGEKFRIDY